MFITFLFFGNTGKFNYVYGACGVVKT